MEPTLQGTGASSLIGQDRRAEKTPGTITLDHVLVDCLSYRFTELKRGDFLAFKTGNIDAMARRHPPGAQDQVWVELLISLPGEFVKFFVWDTHAADGLAGVLFQKSVILPEKSS